MRIFVVLFLVLSIVFATLLACPWLQEIVNQISPPPPAESWRPLSEISPSEQTTLRIGFDTMEDFGVWQSHHFSGESTVARVATDEAGEFMLDVRSNRDATLFLKAASVQPQERPVLTWQWRVQKFPEGKENQEFAEKHESDFAARVYVVFEGFTNFTSDTIQYIWDDHFPVETHRSIPFFKHLKMVVVRSQGSSNGEWLTESRDIVKDYEMLYGKYPRKNIRAFGVMTDADNLETVTHAQYKNIEVKMTQAVTVIGPPPEEGVRQDGRTQVVDQMGLTERASKTAQGTFKWVHEGVVSNVESFRKKVPARFRLFDK